MPVKTHQLHLIVAHRQPALTPKDSVRRKSRVPIFVVFSFPTAFYRLIDPSAVTILIAHRMMSAFSVKLSALNNPANASLAPFRSEGFS